MEIWEKLPKTIGASTPLSKTKGAEAPTGPILTGSLFNNDKNAIFRLNQAIQHLMVAWKEKDGPILPFFPVILLGYYFFPFAICAL